MSNIPLKYTETNLVGTIVNIAVTDTATTIYATFKDSKTNVARTPDASTNLFVIDKNTEQFEMILSDSHATSGGVTTITVNSSGRALNEYLEGTGSGTGLPHAIGAEIGCVETQAPEGTLNEIVGGTNNTTGEDFRVGNDADSDIKIYAANGDTNEPWYGYNAAGSKWVFSNDGVSSTDFGTGAGVSGGDGIDVTASVISTDLATNPGLEISSSKIRVKIKANGGVTRDGDGLSVDQTNAFDPDWLGTHNFVDVQINEAVQLTSTSSELNKLDGASANVTAANLNILTAGSDADNLHYHDITDFLADSNRQFYLMGYVPVQATGGTATQFGTSINLVTNSANNAFGYARAIAYTKALAGMSVHNKNPRFIVTAKYNSAVAQEGFIGCVNASFVGTSLENSVMTLDHFGFIVQDGTLFISCANGTTQTKTDISGTIPDVTAGHEFEAMFDGTTAQFWVDGAGMGTINTNVPNGTMDLFCTAVVADATGAAKTLLVSGSGAFSYDQ